MFTTKDLTRLGFTFTLQDGDKVYVRPVLPEDKERLARGYEMLSERSKRLRFFIPLSHLHEDILRYLTEVDHYNHEAWGALDPRHPELPGIGIGRYIRLDEEPEVAEIAIVVLDAWQGKGIGLLLFSVLYLRALSCNISTFRAYILPENAYLLERLRELQAVTFHYAEGLMVADIPLYRDLRKLPHTRMAQLFRKTVRAILKRQPLLRPEGFHP